MRLPKVKNSGKYVGLYVFDFGESCSVGFTAEEMAELLESEKFKDGNVYKIKSVRVDGTMELVGVRREMFELESGMFFYSGDISKAMEDYKKLVAVAVKSAPPARAKVHLGKYDDEKYVVGLIYPAEYEDGFSSWLLESGYFTAGAACGGIGSVESYYKDSPELIERHQLFGRDSLENRTGEELLCSVKLAVQR